MFLKFLFAKCVVVCNYITHVIFYLKFIPVYSALWKTHSYVPIKDQSSSHCYDI